MKLILLCVGNLKASPEKDLVEQYRTRITWPLDIKEVVCKRTGSPDQIKNWEGELLLEALDPSSIVIGLDEKGSSMTSADFAHLLQNYQMEGTKSLTFVIGGAGGLTDVLRKRCQRLISLGRMTWPHLLVRGMLVEQFYRAQQILLGHPYHRE